jgi:hypothetical protein
MSWQYFRAVISEVRKPETYPFAIGFGVVLFLAGYYGRVGEEDYRRSVNPRFSKPFLKGAEHHGAETEQSTTAHSAAGTSS